ncbi:MAG: OmpA family protein [Bacteroidia bacterium]|nr:OmpA family protein [Bacteroidia bacterium]
MKSGIFLTTVYLLLSPILYAQEIEFNKDLFKNKDDYRAAKDFVNQGNSDYEKGRGSYRNALNYYLKAYKLYDRNAALNYRIGNCYFYSVNKVKCIDYFLSAYQLNKNIMKDILLKIACGYNFKYEFDKAIEYYQKYKSSLTPGELQDEKDMINKKIEECNIGKELIKSPVRVFIDNVGDNVNSTYPDYSPLISTDESMMIFTSKRPCEGNKLTDDGYYFEKIFISYSENGGNDWLAAENIGKPLNENDNNNATVGLSPDGQQLFTFTGDNGGDILVSELKGEEWSKPNDDAVKKFINTPSHESSASFSFDGRTMYFDSNKETDNFDTRNLEEDLMERTHDIYYSEWGEEKQRWMPPVNLGNVINTEYDERGVFMHPDGRTIYFSSKGHKTIGGLDIFKSERNDEGQWSEPENLGYPVNTPDDDVFFVMAASGKHGYFSSVREDGVGDYDIYRITFRGPEKSVIQSNEDNLLASTEPVSEVVMEETVEIKTMRLTILKGTVKDAISLQLLEASIEIVDNEKNEVISVMKSNSATGKYLVSLPSGKNYGIAVKAQDYLFHSENFIIPEATTYQEITKDILLNKMAVGSKIILKNIFFDYAKATLRPESAAELDRLVKLLTEYPTTRIEISGHTDNIGTLKLNTDLSQNRAKAVVDYLIKNGISADRLEYKGYAYFQPIDTNDTDEGRQNNRRVEFKILSN